MRRISIALAAGAALVVGGLVGTPGPVGAGQASPVTATVSASPLSVTVGQTFTATGTWTVSTPLPGGTILNVLLEMQGTDGVVGFDDPPTASAGLTGCAFTIAPRAYRCTIQDPTVAQTYTITAVGRPTGVPSPAQVTVLAATSGAISIVPPTVEVAIAAAPTTTTTTTTIAATTTTAAATTTTVAPTTTGAASTTTIAGGPAIPGTGSGESTLLVACLLAAGGAVALLVSRRRPASP